MAVLVGYVLGIVLVLGCMFVAMLSTDRLCSEVGIIQVTPVRVLVDLVGSAIGFVVGLTLVNFVSI